SAGRNPSHQSSRNFDSCQHRFRSATASPPSAVSGGGSAVSTRRAAGRKCTSAPRARLSRARSRPTFVARTRAARRGADDPILGASCGGELTTKPEVLSDMSRKVILTCLGAGEASSRVIANLAAIGTVALLGIAIWQLNDLRDQRMNRTVQSLMLTD